jgi:hypothetical protein
MTLTESTKLKSGTSSGSAVNVETTYYESGGSSVDRPLPSRVRALAVGFDNERMVVDLADGRAVSVPLRFFPRLHRASLYERINYELVGGGSMIHWPELDEDIDVPNLLRT